MENQSSQSQKPRAILYARVAVESQNGQTSFERQMSAMRHLALERDLEIVGEYAEVASGNRRYRLQLEEILTCAGQGGFDILVVCDLSRLSRNFRHLIDIIATLTLHNIGLMIVNSPGLDLASPMGRVCLNTLAYLDLLFQESQRNARLEETPAQPTLGSRRGGRNYQNNKNG